MARIRTIKPDFFTSADITALSPIARLLYIGTWLEADREGLFRWNAGNLKLRYLPADSCDVQGVASELISRGLIVLYGNGLACIPKFSEHQYINPKEPKSRLPRPTEEELARVPDASGRVPHAPSLPSYSLPSIPFRSGTLILSPAEYAKKLEFCAFVGSRLEVPKSLHRELIALLGGIDPDARLLAWYETVNTEIEVSAEPIAPSVYKWLKARYQVWTAGMNGQSVSAAIDNWGRE